MRIIFSSITSEYSRSDKFISDILKLSRRKVSFLFFEEKVFINNKKVKKGCPINRGDLIEVTIDENRFDYSDIKIIKETDDFLIIYKPPKIHSQELFNSKKSVENFLMKKFKNSVKLLNRLDFASQGLMIAAKNDQFFDKFKLFEINKKIEKFYLTFINGRFNKKLLITNAIDYRDRKIVKVLNKSSEIIQTELLPLSIYENFSMIIAKIFKGARHQIRAHLSYIGNPLIGDPIYGKSENLDFFLFCFGYKCKELNLDIINYRILKKEARNYLNILLNN